MKTPTFRRLLTVALLASYAAASLYPFQWEPPRRAPNRAELVPDRGVRFREPGIARSKESPCWVAAAKQSHRLELSLRVRSFSTDQSGPARIITLSLDPYLRNFTVGQESDDLVFRLRTPWTNFNGTLDDAEFVQVPDVFRSRAWVDLRILVRPKQLRIMIGNRIRARKALPREPLQDWDTSYRLALGNELTYNRPWLGEIRHAVVRTKGMSVNYVNPSLVEVVPSGFWIIPSAPNIVPFRDFDLRDAMLNLIAYVPFGLLLGTWYRQRTRLRSCYPVLIVFAVSLSMEAMQVFMARYPSVSDLIFNTAGGIIGLLLSRTALANRWLEAKL